VSGWITLYDHFTAPSVEIVGVVPVNVFLETKVRIDGKEAKSTSHGISFVVRVQNGNRPVSLSVLELRGKVLLTFQEYLGIWDARNGLPMEQVEKEFLRRKPYRVIEWVGWPEEPDQVARMEPHEERYVKFTFLEATFGSGGWFRRAPLSDFIGFDDGTKKPKWIDEFPEPPIVFVGASGRMLAADLREDLREGRTHLFLKVASGSVPVPADRIQTIRRVPKEDWQGAPVQADYFGKNYWKASLDTPPFNSQ